MNIISENKEAFDVVLSSKTFKRNLSEKVRLISAEYYEVLCATLDILPNDKIFSYEEVEYKIINRITTSDKASGKKPIFSINKDVNYCFEYLTLVFLKEVNIYKESLKGLQSQEDITNKCLSIKKDNCIILDVVLQISERHKFPESKNFNQLKNVIRDVFSKLLTDMYLVECFSHHLSLLFEIIISSLVMRSEFEKMRTVNFNIIKTELMRLFNNVSLVDNEQYNETLSSFIRGIPNYVLEYNSFIENEKAKKANKKDKTSKKEKSESKEKDKKTDKKTSKKTDKKIGKKDAEKSHSEEEAPEADLSDNEEAPEADLSDNEEAPEADLSENEEAPEADLSENEEAPEEEVKETPEKVKRASVKRAKEDGEKKSKKAKEDGEKKSKKAKEDGEKKSKKSKEDGEKKVKKPKKDADKKIKK
jgi:chemotaxis protein histidine kinase CheA